MAAEGRSREEIGAALEMSAATLYNWRRQYGGMGADAAKELRAQNGRLKRLLADAELEKDALMRSPGGLRAGAVWELRGMELLSAPCANN